MADNLAILDRNILHAFEAHVCNERLEDAYLKLRDKFLPLEAERRCAVLHLAYKCLNVAWRNSNLPDRIRDRGMMEVSDFMVERLLHAEELVPFPMQPLSAAVALADKLDTLVGMFGIGERPDGSGDKYALRRATLGVLRICAAQVQYTGGTYG